MNFDPRGVTSNLAHRYFFELTDTLKQQTNTIIGTLAVDGWVVKFETGSGWEGAERARDTVLRS